MRRSTWLLLGALALATTWIVLDNIPYAPSRSSAPQMAYSDLMAELDKGTVRVMVVKGRAITGDLKDGRAFMSYSPTEPEKLVELALASGTRIIARPADTDPDPLLHYLLSWAPWLLWLWVFRSIALRLIIRAADSQSARIAQLEARLAALEAKPPPFVLVVLRRRRRINASSLPLPRDRAGSRLRLHEWIPTAPYLLAPSPHPSLAVRR